MDMIDAKRIEALLKYPYSKSDRSPKYPYSQNSTHETHELNWMYYKKNIECTLK